MGQKKKFSMLKLRFYLNHEMGAPFRIKTFWMEALQEFLVTCKKVTWQRVNSKTFSLASLNCMRIGANGWDF